MFGNNDIKTKQSINDKYFWTQHSLYKLKQYGLSQQRIKRVIRVPERMEEGVVKNTVAVMQPVSVKRDKKGKNSWKQEIWCMYQLRDGTKSKLQNPNSKQIQNSKFEIQNSANRKICIISAWKYPGISPKNNPIPQDILDEIENRELW